MLNQLFEDQQYRNRWMRERTSSRARRRRAAAWVVSIAGGLVVMAGAVAQLIHSLF
jgi:hypothetical protein